MSLKRMIILGLLITALLFVLPYSVPFIFALITAIILEPLIRFFIKRMSMKRPIAVTISFILFLAVFGTGAYLLGSKIVIQTMELAPRLPEFSYYVFDTAKSLINQLQATLPAESINESKKVIDYMGTWAIEKTRGIATGVLGLVAAIPGLLIEAIIYLVALYLISLDLPGLTRRFMSMFTESARQKIELIYTQLSRATTGFLAAQVFLSILTYVLALGGLLILDVKYATLLALLIMVVDILPILGTGSILVPWAVYSFVTGNNGLGIGLLVLFAAITVIRRIVEPKVLGTSLGISSLAALVSIWLGFQIMGLAGLILGPALVIIFEALRKAGFLKMKIDF